jgi:hypothetical protein
MSATHDFSNAAVARWILDTKIAGSVVSKMQVREDSQVREDIRLDAAGSCAEQNATHDAAQGLRAKQQSAQEHEWREAEAALKALHEREQQELRAKRRAVALAAREKIMQKMDAMIKQRLVTCVVCCQQRLPHLCSVKDAWRGHLLCSEPQCMDCEVLASDQIVPEGWKKITDTDVPVSAFRQMGVDGWFCSPEDLAFAQTLVPVTHPEMTLEFLEDEYPDSPRSQLVTSRAEGLLEDEESYSDGSELCFECDFDDLDQEIETHMRMYGADRELRSLIDRFHAACKKPQIWITESLADRVDLQLEGLSILRHFDGY